MRFDRSGVLSLTGCFIFCHVTENEAKEHARAPLNPARAVTKGSRVNSLRSNRPASLTVRYFDARRGAKESKKANRSIIVFKRPSGGLPEASRSAGGDSLFTDHIGRHHRERVLKRSLGRQ